MFTNFYYVLSMVVDFGDCNVFSYYSL